MTTVADISLDEILAKLRALEPAIRAQGVTRLAMFGSRVRGDHRPDSDLDILLEHARHASGRPFFDLFKVMHLIEDALGLPPHIMTDSELTPRIRKRMADDDRGLLMPPSSDDRLNDILSAIEKIERATRGMNVGEFADNEVVRAATERLLGVVCEASLRLPDSIKKQAPGIGWRNMNDFANLLRHVYHSTSVDLVWDIVQIHLPPLKAFVEQRVRSGGQ